MFQLTHVMYMRTLKFSYWINFCVFHELVCTHEIKTTCYTQLCVTKPLQIVKSKTTKFLCSKLSQSIFLSTCSVHRIQDHRLTSSSSLHHTTMWRQRTQAVRCRHPSPPHSRPLPPGRRTPAQSGTRVRDPRAQGQRTQG